MIYGECLGHGTNDEGIHYTMYETVDGQFCFINDETGEEMPNDADTTQTD